MSRQTRQRYVPVEEYLALERASDYKSEYFDGEIVAMTGASRAHNLIALNIAAELRTKLRGRPCETYPSDMRVRVRGANLYTYPDVVVVCGEPRFEDAAVDTLLNPTLLVEVLSKSTSLYDHGLKAGYYRTIESLSEYLLVSQEEPRVEQYARRDDSRWLLTDVRGLETTVELTSIGCELTLAEIYERVDFNSRDDFEQDGDGLQPHRR